MSPLYKTEAGKRAVETRYRTFLDRWPVDNEQFFVSTRQGDTFVIASGPPGAPALILLHGAAFNSVSWMGDVSAWSAQFRVYCVDIIGHPGFSAPSRPPYDSDDHALWLDDVLDGLVLERSSLVGISLGGWLAIDYASRRPDRVASLVVLAPGGVGRELTSMMKLLFIILPLMAMGDWGRSIAQRLLLGPMPSRVDPRAEEASQFASLVYRHFCQRLDKVARFDDARLARLNMPVLLIVGAKDPMLDPYETIERLRCNAPQTEVLLLKDVGHVLVGQTAPILAFVERNDA
jgi:pimeloyl-ACP methyl ester carboxylesterase